MQKLFVFSFSVLFLFFLVSNISAQQWSDAQNEVWSGVEEYWAASTSSDPMSFLNYFDETYQGWSYESETPGNRNDAVKSLGYWFSNGKVQYYIIKPSKIWVNGDFAFVHYYYTQVAEGPDGKPNTERGRWTDILMKKDGKWMLVGDHGGEVKD